MIPLPLPLLLKYGGMAAFVIAVYAFGHHQGAKGIQGDWDASKAKVLADQQGALLSHLEAMDAARKAQEETTIKVSEDYERALNEVKEKHDADLLAVRRAGGLRVPRSICNSPAAAASETTSNSSGDADTTGTVSLPETITNDLFSEAKRADEVAEIARACQSWIRQQGYYGVPIPD
ncbi:MAG: lysis system i-spanin subunit Rz [Pseudomonadota bacterium]